MTAPEPNLLIQIRQLLADLRSIQSSSVRLPTGVSISHINACIDRFEQIEEHVKSGHLPARAHRNSPTISRIIADSWPSDWPLVARISATQNAFYQAPERSAQ